MRVCVCFAYTILSRFPSLSHSYKGCGCIDITLPSLNTCSRNCERKISLYHNWIPAHVVSWLTNHVPDPSSKRQMVIQNTEHNSFCVKKVTNCTCKLIKNLKLVQIWELYTHVWMGKIYTYKCILIIIITNLKSPWNHECFICAHNYFYFLTL